MCTLIRWWVYVQISYICYFQRIVDAVYYPDFNFDEKWSLSTKLERLRKQDSYYYYTCIVICHILKIYVISWNIILVEGFFFQIVSTKELDTTSFNPSNICNDYNDWVFVFV